MTHKEMLEILRGKVLHESVEETQQRLNEIADAFEQTIHERDAAVADLKRYAPCPTCKTVDIEHCINCVFCNTHGKTVRKNKWEWRGVQDEQTN